MITKFRVYLDILAFGSKGKAFLEVLFKLSFAIDFKLEEKW